MDRPHQFEVIEILDDFICDAGLWEKFKQFVEEKGYTVEELGFTDDA